jgi:hypothetical protein
MPDLGPWLIGLVLALLIAFLYWADRRYPAPSKPRERPVLLTYCAWCAHRDGDDCTHPNSPVWRCTAPYLTSERHLPPPSIRPQPRKSSNQGGALHLLQSQRRGP